MGALRQKPYLADRANALYESAISHRSAPLYRAASSKKAIRPHLERRRFQHFAIMKTTIFALVLVCALVRGIAAEAPKYTDQASIQGIWLAQTESLNGHKKNVAYEYIFRGDKFTFKDESGKEVKYSFKLDTAGNLKLLVLRPAESLTNSTPVSIAYELAGDSLTIVIAPRGSRPTEISDKNNQELIICKRKSP